MNEQATETSRELLATMERSERNEVELPVGLHEGIALERYLKIDAASNTALGELRKSPAHLKAMLDGEVVRKVDPESVGSALHCLILEGEKVFQARYRQGPVDNKTLKAWKGFDGSLPRGVIGIKPAEWKAIQRMADNINAHPAARLALGGITLTELTGLWVDEDTGVRCKMRCDAINPSLAACIDLKTTRDASEYAFEKSVFSYGYYRQGAFYQMGLQALVPDTEWRHHVIISIEKEPPFAVQVFRLQEDALYAGREEIAALLPVYRTCTENGHYPAYSDEFVDVTIPTWAWNQVQHPELS